ncbi:PIN domain-like protein [Metschnikowia bicuspidata]|uniref:PIN domain-like protein n=1 Tax=Metschnikowia bicuspidata TaxID=27322 RepID=A0A4P9ZCE3_9ASCO|nr:PIN domain-like protein [Metschnikowia bicuspidata]
MGVKSLWEIIGPAARPVKLEALSRKKLAIDASIWIYQFLKAVRDKEGNALGTSHIVGFFRRICKLLYFGILPLFVFDGGAPALKRKVLQSRRARREGHRENMAVAAQKILIKNIQRRLDAALGPLQRQRNAAEQPTEFTYLEDTPQHGGTRHSPGASGKPVQVVPDTSPERPFRKKDEYDLPELKQFTYRQGDERIMPMEEYDAYGKDISQDVVDGIRIDSVDPSSQEFADLPMATQYMILWQLRLRSRLRLGYTKSQLEQLFPDSRDFSKFQIQQVQKRNYYTQQLMNVSGMDVETGHGRRLAGDRDKRYLLVKNDDGWTLSLGEGESGEKPVELDPPLSPQQREARADVSAGLESDDNDLEDVALGDEARELAVVQAIYDQYTDDYSRPETAPLGDSAPPGLLEVLHDWLESALERVLERKLPVEQITPVELQKVVEESLKQEKVMLDAFFSATGHAGFDLGESFLFLLKPHLTGSDAPMRIDGPIAKQADAALLGLLNLPEYDREKFPVRQTVPSWFGADNQVANPHQGMGFIPDRAGERQMNEDEQVGLIDWTEAKQFLEQRDESDSGVEVIEELSDAGTEKRADDQIERLDQNEPPDQKESPRKAAAPLDYDFDEEEEELLRRQLLQEEQEHASFAARLKTSSSGASMTVTDEQLLQEKLQKAKRDADEVTETMINDVQELLKRFGIPYITAPMEAEAQCAELFAMGMVDGIVTDDSDCFLFGGSRVYKNMFNQKQYVECYTGEDIERTCGLNRDRLIELAFLLGSDYTEGIKGIGPVLAMEILAEFGDLCQFKEWFDSHTKATAPPSAQYKLQKALLARVRSDKLFLPDSFPDPAVVRAYKHAEVDRDDSMFKWGVPRLDHIRSFLVYNVGWTQERVDEVMVPLVQNMNRQRQEGTQATIGEFFPQEYISYRKDMALGKRMKVAAEKLKGDG